MFCLLGHWPLVYQDSRIRTRRVSGLWCIGLAVYQDSPCIRTRRVSVHGLFVSGLLVYWTCSYGMPCFGRAIQMVSQLMANL
jgi:hypothetical protein